MMGWTGSPPPSGSEPAATVALKGVPGPLRRLVVVLVAVLAVVGVLYAGVGIVALHRLDANLVRLPSAFAGLDAAARPPASDDTTLVIVLVDSGDSGVRSAADIGEPPGVVLVSRIIDGRAAIVALRPDPQTIPDHLTTPHRAFELEGPGGAVLAVERLTGLRVDHFFILDMADLPAIVDAISGVNLPTSDSLEGFPAQLRLRPVTGREALGYARGEHEFAAGAAGRGYRWATVLRSLVQGISQEMLLDPIAVIKLADALGAAAYGDESLDSSALLALAARLGGLRSRQVTVLSAPDSSGRSVSAAAADPLWPALRSGPLPLDYLERHPSYRLRWRAGT